MPNMKSLMNDRNQKTLQAQPQISPKSCNFIKKDDCPMNVLCLTESVLHYAKISCEGKKSPTCIKEFSKQGSKNALQSTKNLLTLKPAKMALNFTLSIGLKKESTQSKTVMADQMEI